MHMQKVSQNDSFCKRTGAKPGYTPSSKETPYPQRSTIFFKSIEAKITCHRCNNFGLPFRISPPNVTLLQELRDGNQIPPPKIKVACGHCRYFVRDTIGDGFGIGECLKGHVPQWPEYPLYPKVERFCDKISEQVKTKHHYVNFSILIFDKS